MERGDKELVIWMRACAHPLCISRCVNACTYTLLCIHLPFSYH